jgi:hypothetical protein
MGGGGIIYGSTNANFSGMPGGSSGLGFGQGAAGAIALNASASGNPGGLYGGGGSGGVASNSATNVAGGNGAAGIVVVTEFCTA